MPVRGGRPRGTRASSFFEGGREGGGEMSFPLPFFLGGVRINSIFRAGEQQRQSATKCLGGVGWGDVFLILR